MFHTNNGDFMKNNSIWKENVENKNLPKLKKNIECDILIIGGGIAGLSTAYFLRNSNKNVVLIDKDKCAEGASSRNTGKLTFMQELVYHKIEKNYTSEMADLYLKSQRDAISLALNIINDNNIDCNLYEQDAYVFIQKEKDKKKINEEIKFYNRNKIDCKIVKKVPFNFSFLHGIKTRGSYSFNPYKFLVKIKNILEDKIKIYENTRATLVKREDGGYVIKTENGNTIKTKKVVIATQYPFFIVPYFVPFKTTVEKSFIVSGRKTVNEFQFINEGKPTISINFYKEADGYLLYSRRSHSITTNLDTRDDRKEIIYEYKKYFGKNIEYYFQNHDLITYDYMPFIGKIDDVGMFVLTGFNKWGNTNGIIGGKLISDLLLDKKNEYESLFNPKRNLSLLKIKNLTIYNSMVMTRYILNKIVSSKTYYDDRVSIEYIDGKKCGVYTDENGRHIVSNICPHMKCNLVFNYVDKTWDCPCHASRFDIDGNVVWGPSVYDIKINKE